MFARSKSDDCVDDARGKSASDAGTMSENGNLSEAVIEKESCAIRMRTVTRRCKASGCDVESA